MGDSLVMYTIPEEALGWAQRQREARARRDAGEVHVPIWKLEREFGPDPSRWPKPSGRTPLPSPGDFRAHAMTELGIPDGGVWDPPGEPREHDWWRKPELRRQHADAVRRSLEEFLNGHLAHLYHMLRTGWWVLGKARVRVVECRPVPEREMRAMARAFKPKKKAERKKTETRAREHRSEKRTKGSRRPHRRASGKAKG